MSIDKKLGVWGKDKIVREDRKTHASDYYCIACYADKKEVPAVGFWPNIDLDIRSFPYCREHIDEFKIKIILATADDCKAK